MLPSGCHLEVASLLLSKGHSSCWCIAPCARPVPPWGSFPPLLFLTNPFPSFPPHWALHPNGIFPLCASHTHFLELHRLSHGLVGLFLPQTHVLFPFFLPDFLLFHPDTTRVCSSACLETHRLCLCGFRQLLPLLYPLGKGLCHLESTWGEFGSHGGACWRVQAHGGSLVGVSTAGCGCTHTRISFGLKKREIIISEALFVPETTQICAGSSGCCVFAA